MRITSLAVISIFISAVNAFAGPSAAKAKAQARCGWFDNPTPANVSLTDKDGEWLISKQGGYSAEGIEKLPEDFGDNWVETNGPHGYGCACLTVRVNASEKKILSVLKSKVLPIRKCRNDRSLPKR